MPNIPLGERISTPVFLHNSEELLYLKDPLDARTDGTLQVCTDDADGNVEEPAVDVESSANFFDEPAISYDDRYVLIEATFEPQGDDDYAGSPQPKKARLVLYDRLDGRVVSSNTRGIDPVWNR